MLLLAAAAVWFALLRPPKGADSPAGAAGDAAETARKEAPCPPQARAEWRAAQAVEGVSIEADASCQPDNPHTVAAAVKGTNNVTMPTLMSSRLAHDAVVKRDDLDGDGDPDRIHIKLEVNELNGFSPDMPEPSLAFSIAPGVRPGAWVFAPKFHGMATETFESNEANELLRLPSPVLRVERGDRISITLENTHYFPHTIHLHGVDHPFELADGQGNDGVPGISEMPVMAGEQRTYEFTPRRAGTFFYHCHVQPHNHILMGLGGMIVVEEARARNLLQTLNVGAGRVRHRSVASRETSDREYDLHYMEIDRELNRIVQQSNDPRRTAKAMNREYKIAERSAEYYLLNGRSFPYTLRESLVVVGPDENIKLRVINTGSEPVYLHPHGHKVAVTHYDGVPLAEPVIRDVVHVGPAQRVQLALETVDDGLRSYGSGVWFMHDHREPAVTTDGIGPGGDISMVVYESYLRADGIPEVAGDLSRFFDPGYYRGRIPVWGHLDERLGDPGQETSR